MSRFFSRNLAGLKAVGLYFKSAGKKQRFNKNTLPMKDVLQKWKRDKDSSRKTKAEDHLANLTRNIKGSSSSWNKRILICNMKTYESIKFTGKSKYIV